MLDEFIKWLESEVVYIEWFNARDDTKDNQDWEPEEEPDFVGYPSNVGWQVFGLEPSGNHIENLRAVLDEIKALQKERHV